MTKRKGAGLPEAVMICSLLLIISLMVSSFIISVYTLNNASNISNNNRLLFQEYTTKFINGENVESFPNTKVNWETKEKGDNPSVKALIAHDKNNNSIVFYTIYDFANSSYLAYQTSNIYIENNYLGGIIYLGE